MRPTSPLWIRRFLLAAAVAAYVIVGCAEEADPVRYGFRRVAVSTLCPEPHRTWAVEAIGRLNALGREGWVEAAPGEAVDVTVRCREFPTSCAEDPARCDALGSYQLGDAFVEFDTTRTRDSFTVRRVVMHELIHQRIGAGPVPSRASLHVCRLVNQMPTGCYPGEYGDAVMNPSVVSDGAGSWTDIAGTLSLDIIQPADVSLYRYGLTP